MYWKSRNKHQHERPLWRRTCLFGRRGHPLHRYRHRRLFVFDDPIGKLALAGPAGHRASADTSRFAILYQQLWFCLGLAGGGCRAHWPIILGARNGDFGSKERPHRVLDWRHLSSLPGGQSDQSGYRLAASSDQIIHNGHFLCSRAVLVQIIQIRWLPTWAPTNACFAAPHPWPGAVCASPSERTC